MPKLLFEAHQHTNNKEEISSSTECACFYCFERFSPDKITWAGRDGAVGLCPNCKVDAILGDKSGYNLSDNFLKDMHKHWFEKSVKI